MNHRRIVSPYRHETRPIHRPSLPAVTDKAFNVCAVVLILITIAALALVAIQTAQDAF